ncbi:MAG TPA: matrixin family metalloprotease [Isosphaeraceae bacterium]|nr:matrixin family metalloprotease [Isosphaeraceae bacterium]
MFGARARRRLNQPATRSRAVRPRLEGLEDRVLLYAATGTRWPDSNLVTYSFMPDGTSIGGVPSNLQHTLNASFPTATWQAQITKALAAWEEMADVNFTQVSDDGAPLGVGGDVQGDPRFGDIRIGGFPMASNILAFTYLPPPANGGTSAGDVFFNTSQSWEVNGTTYDLMTVALHEIGHALGLGESTVTTSVMYGSYQGVKEMLTTDDIAGIRSIYGARPFDPFDPSGSNQRAIGAVNLSSDLGSNGQLTLSGLDLAPPLTIGAGEIDWYKITVPATTTGTMVVKMQSAGLSLLSPSLAVYNAAGTILLGQQVSTAMGATATVTIGGVSPGQVYDIRCMGSTTGAAGFGAYGLQVNFGSQSQPPIPSPVIPVPAEGTTSGAVMDVRSSSSAAVAGPLVAVDTVAGNGGALPLPPRREVLRDPVRPQGVLSWTPVSSRVRSTAPVQQFGPKSLLGRSGHDAE